MNMVDATAPQVVRFGALGDMVMLLPTLRLLHDCFGQPVSLVSSGGWTLPLLQQQSCIGSIQLLSSRNAPYWLNRGQREWVRSMQQQPPPQLLLCETDAKSKWLVDKGVQGASTQLHWAQDLPLQPGQHWRDRWLAFGLQAVTSAGLPLPKDMAVYAENCYHVPEPDQQECQTWLQANNWADKPLLLIQPGSKRTMRRGKPDRKSNLKWWPEQNWVELIQAMLLQQPEAQVLICGAPMEAEFTESIAAQVARPNVASIAHDLPISRLAALLQLGHSLVSVDTGPAHLAAEVGCPVAVLFGPLESSVWQPYGSQHKIIQNTHGLQPENGMYPIDEVTVESITVEQVLIAWQAL